MLRFALAYRGWERAKLARRLGVSPPYISNVLAGKENLTLEQIARIFRPLGFRLEFQLRNTRQGTW